MSLRDYAKKIYYQLNPARLPAANALSLGYIFHTEMIFEEKYFQSMMEFLPRYRDLTGSVALATLMSGRNPRVRDGIKSAGISEAEFVRRLKLLAKHSELGFHGHYALQPEQYKNFSKQIRGSVYNMESISIQLQAELDWFREVDLPLGPYYSAGWWFHSPELYRELARQGFQYDFSQSYAPWFRSPVMYPILRAQQVKCGELVYFSFPETKIHLVQNLVGCHNTKFTGDFIRHVANLLHDGSENPIAMVHSHDFDLQTDNALAALEKIKSLGASFFSASSLTNYLSQARKISL